MSSDQRIGTEIAGYRIESLLGRGGMSAVYVAEDRRLRRQVALKVLAPELAESASFRDRFVRESQIAAGMEHPNIVPIYEAGGADGHLFIAMRWIRGTDLRALLDREVTLDPIRTARIGADVASALDAAHEAGLVHRDVKPANILVIEGGGSEGRDLVYLSDFGLTKRLESDSALTKTGQFVGTIDYVAPEQIEGKPVDAQTDVYSLGCVLFECLTGKVPYGRETEVAALYAHLQEKPPRLTKFRPDLPLALDQVFHRALSRWPAHRYPTAGETASALRKALGASSGERASVVSERRPSGAGRRIGLLAAVGVLAAVIVGVVVLLTVGGSSAPPASHGGGRPITATPAPNRTFAIADRPLSENEHRLMGFVPQAIRGACGPFAQPTPDALASIACNTRDGRVVYHVYSTKGAMDAAFDQTRKGISAPSGNCAVQTTAFGTYDVDGQQVGRVLCDLTGRLSTIVWTDDRVLVLAQAFRDDQADLSLYEWWSRAAGPAVELADGSVAVEKDGASNLSIPQGTFMTAISQANARSDRLRFQTEKIGSNATGKWIGAWLIDLHDDGTYALARGKTEYESGRFGVGKGGKMIFQAETGDPDCVAQGPVAYGWTRGPGGISWTDPEGVTGCLPGPWPVNIGRWIAPPTGEIAFGVQGAIATGELAGPAQRVIADGIQPSWSPDGSRFVFARETVPGDFDLYVANADGTGVMLITAKSDPVLSELDPAWSPDGSWIAFHSEDGTDASTLTLIHPDGSARVDIVGPRKANIGRPSWSPDGSMIAFRIEQVVYTVRADGSDLRELTSPDDVFDAPSTWTRDGRHILYWGDDLGPLGLYRMTAAGGNITLLFRAPPEVKVLSPDVSSDGRWVLLAGQWDSPETQTRLFVFDMREGGLYRLSDQLVSEPRWRPVSP